MLLREIRKVNYFALRHYSGKFTGNQQYTKPFFKIHVRRLLIFQQQVALLLFDPVLISAGRLRKLNRPCCLLKHIQADKILADDRGNHRSYHGIV